ncbi:MAG: transglycosylase domain-containing protein [Frankiaceae bacterium]
MTDTMRRLGLLAILGVIAGVLIALVALPLVGGLGYVAGKGADTWERETCGLPLSPPLPQRTHIVAADGSLIADFYYQNRVAVGISQVPPVMREAIIAIEDSRFYEHNGIDPKGALRALVTNQQSGEVVQGGSTLTQQYVKNLFLLTARTKAEQQEAVADTFERKVREARCALDMERRLSKDDILAGYLNIALFGPGIYGVEAASEHYFGKPATRLTLPQAALLAGLVKNPSGYDPVRFPKVALDRRDVVLQRMADLGFVTERQAARATVTRMQLHVRTTHNGCEASRAPYFCEWVLDEVLSEPAFGDTHEERVNALLRGGLTIRTTLDWKAQRAAQSAVVRTVPPGHQRNRRRIAAASVLVAPGTGTVKAMAVNLPFGNGKGRNANNLATGGSTGFQAGSTFKLFTLVTALEQGIPATFMMNAPQTYCSKVFPGYRCDNGLHGVSNAGDSESGRFTLQQATADSVNTYFVQLEEKVGVTRVAATAQRMGVDFTAFPGERPPSAADGSLTLGTWGVSPLEMAEAYATIAAHGRYCAPRAIVSARTADGESLGLAGPQCRQVVARSVADTAAQILTHVINGPGGHTGALAAIGRPAAGKTGTTNGYGAAWFDGFTPQLATAVWVGDPRGPAHPLADFTLNGRYWPRVFGGDLPAMIWAATMKAALVGVPVEDFPPADPELQFGKRVTVPDVAGLAPAQALATLGDNGLQAEVEPTWVHSTQPSGTVAATTPAAGASVRSGVLVRIYLSDGIPPPPPSPSASPSGSPQPSPSPSGSPSPSPSIGPPPVPIPSPTPTKPHKRH